MANCSYCGNEAKDKIKLSTFNGIGKQETDFYYCCEEHKKEIENFSSYVNKNAMKFIVLILLDVFAIMLTTPLGAILKNYNIAGIAMAVEIFLMGLLIIRYPFATPQTNQKLGLKKTIKLTKAIGAVIAFISLIVVIMLSIKLKL